MQYLTYKKREHEVRLTNWIEFLTLMKKLYFMEYEWIDVLHSHHNVSRCRSHFNFRLQHVCFRKNKTYVVPILI